MFVFLIGMGFTPILTFPHQGGRGLPPTPATPVKGEEISCYKPKIPSTDWDGTVFHSDTPRYHPSCAENRSAPLFGVVTAPPRPALHRNLIGTECPDHLVETISLAIFICSLQAGCSRASSLGLGRRISTSADSLAFYSRGTTPYQCKHDSYVAGTLAYHATIGFDCVSNFARRGKMIFQLFDRSLFRIVAPRFRG